MLKPVFIWHVISLAVTGIPFLVVAKNSLADAKPLHKKTTAKAPSSTQKMLGSINMKQFVDAHGK